MFTRRSFLASFASTLALLTSWRPGWAQTTHSANVTFVLFNDFYLMAEQPFPDGKSRGGFARLAAVVKAERERARAEGRTVIVAHGGDTLSPSVMSGLDRGAHIVALTNMIAPDIFVPGNHEFDFGKAVFPRAHGRGDIPALRREFARRRRRARCRASRTARSSPPAACASGSRALPTSSRRACPRRRICALPRRIDTTKAQAAALRQEGADFVCAVLHCNRGDAIKLQYERPAELLLTGHTHDLFVNHDGRCALVESGYDAHYVTCVDVAISVREDGEKRSTTWWPQFRVIDTATVTPDPEVAAAVARFEATLIDKMSEAICVTTVALDSSTATVRTREAAIGNLFADAMRVDDARGRGRAQRRRHPRRQDLRARRAHLARRHSGRAAVQQPHRGGGDRRPRLAARDGERAFAASARGRALPAGLRHRGRVRSRARRGQPRRPR